MKTRVSIGAALALFVVASVANAAPDGSACAEQVVRDLRDGKFDAVAKLLDVMDGRDEAAATDARWVEIRRAA